MYTQSATKVAITLETVTIFLVGGLITLAVDDNSSAVDWLELDDGAADNVRCFKIDSERLGVDELYENGFKVS